MSMNEEAESIDLETYTSLLGRGQMERLIVTFIVKNPDFFDDLAEAAGKFDEEEFLGEIDKIENDWEVEEDSSSTFDQVDTVLQRSLNMLKINQLGFSVVILYHLTNLFVVKLIEEDYEDGKMPDLMNEMFSSVENAWKDVIAKFEVDTLVNEKNNSGIPKSLQGIFDQLAIWRTKLQTTYGPLFSDPLRVAKKQLTTMDGEQANKKQRTA